MRFLSSLFPPKKKNTEEQAYRCPFSIRSSVSPSPEGFDLLNKEETEFFQEFERRLIESKINPFNISLTRLSSGIFNVDHVRCYVGKIGLRPETVPDKYAVWRNGGKRALRVFESKEDAERYRQEKNADIVEFRKGYTEKFCMQYSCGLYDTKCINTTNLQDCIDAIPYWIRYIKRYGR